MGASGRALPFADDPAHGIVAQGARGSRIVALRGQTANRIRCIEQTRRRGLVIVEIGIRRGVIAIPPEREPVQRIVYIVGRGGDRGIALIRFRSYPRNQITVRIVAVGGARRPVGGRVVPEWRGSPDPLWFRLCDQFSQAVMNKGSGKQTALVDGCNQVTRAVIAVIIVREKAGGGDVEVTSPRCAAVPELGGARNFADRS